MVDFRYLGSDNYNLLVECPDLPVFAAVRGAGDRWSLIGPSVMELCQGVRCVAVLDSRPIIDPSKAVWGYVPPC